MFKKILYTCLCFTISTVAVFAQTINVTNIVAEGHFDPLNPAGGGGCNLGLPVITATYQSGVGSTVQNGAIVCTNQCGNTTVRINLSNVRWSKNPNNNWFHGITFTPNNVTVNVPSGGLPAGWFPFPSCTGSSCSSGLSTGVGLYFDGSTGQSCCTNTLNDGIPGNNYGDPLADCNFDYSYTFDLTFCNSSITANPLLFSARGTSDYQTGCWTGVDVIGTSKIQFVLATSAACTQPIFTTLPTATAPVKSCAGGTVNYTSTLTSACGSGAGVTWWTAATGGTQVGTGSPFVYDPPGSACPSGTTLYAACCPIGNTCATRRAVTIGGVCSPALDITNVDITNPTCGTTGSINSVTVTGNAGPVLYTLNPGNMTNNTGVFLGLTGLSYTLTAIDDAGCSKTVPVTFTPGGTGGTPPTVVSPVTYCQNQISPAVLPLVANITVAGGILTWYLPGSTIGQSTAPIPAINVAGTFTYNVTQTVGSCVSAQVPIVVNINSTPVAPSAATPIYYCQNASSSALIASGINLRWYANATTTTPLPGAPTPSTATVGNTTYYVSQSNAAVPPATGLGCESVRAAITVTINVKPAAPTVITDTVRYCQGSTAVMLTANGTNLKWYTDATTTTPLPGAPTPSTATIGNTTYYVSQSTTNTPPATGCESGRTAITVKIIAIPAAPTVAADTVRYCQGATASTLTANGTNLKWYIDAITTTPLPAAPTPSTATLGITTYYVSQSSTPIPASSTVCESGRTAIAIKVIAIAAAPTVAADTVRYCLGATAAALTANGTNLLWYATASGGVGSTVAPTISTASVGNTTYFVSQSTSATAPACEGPRAAITITVNPKPTVPAVTTPVKYCQNAAAIALIANGTNLLWYTVATGGTGSATAIVPSTASVGSTTYYVSQKSGLGCEGDRAPIVVDISAGLTVNAGNAVTIANGDQTQLNGTATAGTNYLWTANVAPLALSSATILNPIANPIATTTYRLTVSDPANLCPSVNSSVTVTVVQSCINVRNAFTPNGDGVNDYWLVYDQNFCLQAGGAAVTVFNRYGSKVFESKNYTNNWDGTYKGKAVPDGTYYAVLEFVLFNGTKQFVKTDITILR